MGLPLKTITALNGIAAILAEFLPYSGAFEGRGQITYRSIANDLGVGAFWEKMSKTPGLARLLERILEHRSGEFERFILRAVKDGLRYREKNGTPIKRAEIEKLNGLIRDVGFKFPDLWDEGFLAALDTGLNERARAHVQAEKQAEKIKVERTVTAHADLAALRSDLFALHTTLDKHAAGYAFEKLLNKLFNASGLNPRAPFKLVGEQIDGSFELDHETYLVEAKWEKAAANQAALLVFRGKIEGKTHVTRGVFISLNGITAEAEDAITRGKQANFFVVDGYDLSVVLAGSLTLVELLRHKRRRWTEEGRIRYSAKDILDNLNK